MTPRTFAQAFVAPADVARFEREGWHVVGQDPRYGSVIMQRDGVPGETPERSVTLGRSAA